MRRWVGIALAACLYYSGLVGLARWLMRRSEPCLIILNYHRASQGNLRRHLCYLRRYYRMMHLEEALEEIYGVDAGQRHGGDPRTPLVLTFDDGYRDNYTHAFPLVLELQVPITIFLVPGYIESGALFWWLEGQHLVRHTQAENIQLAGQKYCLCVAQEREALAQVVQDNLWHSTSVAEREALLATLREKLPTSQPVIQDELPLTWNEVLKMQESGLVSFGAHTMHHPILAHLRSAEEIRYEISTCREVLEQRLHCNVRTFAYPVGRTRHIGDVALFAVRDVGYSWAVTTMSGVSTEENDPYQVQRVLGDVTRHWLVMAAEVSGAWKWFSPLWKKSLFKKGMVGDDVA